MILSLKRFFSFLNDGSKNRKSVQELKDLPNGIYHYSFALSKSKQETIECLCDELIANFSAGKAYQLNEGEKWNFEDTDRGIRFWRSAEGQAIGVWSSYCREMNNGLLGFVPFEYYLWIEHLEYHDSKIGSIVNLEFDPFDELIFLSIQIEH